MLLEESPLRIKSDKDQKTSAIPLLSKATSDEYLEDGFESFYSDYQE